MWGRGRGRSVGWSLSLGIRVSARPSHGSSGPRGSTTASSLALAGARCTASVADSLRETRRDACERAPGRSRVQPVCPPNARQSPAAPVQRRIGGWLVRCRNVSRILHGGKGSSPNMQVCLGFGGRVGCHACLERFARSGSPCGGHMCLQLAKALATQ